MKRLFASLAFFAMLQVPTLFAEQLEFPIRDYPKTDAVSEGDIISWSKKVHDYTHTEKVELEDKNFFILIGSKPLATTRLNIFIYVSEQKTSPSDKLYSTRWALLLFRPTVTSQIKIDVDRKTKQITFRSRSGKVLLIQPFETEKAAEESPGEGANVTITKAVPEEPAKSGK